MGVQREMEWSAALDLLVKELETMDEEVMDEIEKRVKRRTPVDTGRARNSWGVEKRGTTLALVSDDSPGKMIALEYGHSNQSPQGMIRITASEIDDIVHEVIKDKE